MSIDDNEALVQRFCTAVFEDGNLDAIESLTTDDFVDSTLPVWATAGRDGLRQHIAFRQSTFGEYRFTIQDQVADEDMRDPSNRADGVDAPRDRSPNPRSRERRLDG